MFGHVVCHIGPRDELAEEIRALGIPVFDLSGGKRYSLLALLRLGRLVRRLRPTLIHADQDYAKLYARLASRLLRVPLLTTRRLTVPGRSARALAWPLITSWPSARPCEMAWCVARGWRRPVPRPIRGPGRCRRGQR